MSSATIYIQHLMFNVTTSEQCVPSFNISKLHS